MWQTTFFMVMMNNQQLSQKYQSMRNYNSIADCDQTKRISYAIVVLKVRRPSQF